MSLPSLEHAAFVSDARAFEEAVHAQVNAQIRRAKWAGKIKPVTNPPKDTEEASKQLHAAGALKTYKPDAVSVRAQMESLPLPQLHSLLKQQSSLLSSPSLLRNLPDGGAKIREKVEAIKQIIAVREAQEAQVREVESMLDQVNLQQGTGGEEEKQEGGATATAAAALSAAAARPASSSSSSSSSAAAAPSPSLLSGTSLLGRGSSAAAFISAPDHINARLQRQNESSLTGKFWRPPPQVISPDEANKLIQIKNDEWNAEMMLFNTEPMKLASTSTYRDFGADADDDDEGEEQETSQIREEEEEEDDEDEIGEEPASPTQ